MPAVSGLKKKLKSVRAAGRLSKAMKTVATVKFSKLSTLFKNYSFYAEEYKKLCRSPDAEKVGAITKADAVVVLGANKNLCGSFNNELVSYFREKFPPEALPDHFFVCGEALAGILAENGYEGKIEKKFVFDDVPAFSECEELCEALSALAAKKKDLRVTFVRPFYKNTLIQTPGTEVLIPDPGGDLAGTKDVLLIPDGATVREEVIGKCFRAALYGAVLETALGAQAATLMAMRSAYDTAKEYGEAIEGELQRRRQQDVTADVIETASENAGADEGENANG